MVDQTGGVSGASSNPTPESVSQTSADHLKASAEQAAADTEVVEPSYQSTYIDIGKLYGNEVISSMISWWPEPVCIDKQKLNDFFDPFFDALKRQKVETVELSFAQLSDITNFLKGAPGSATDTIASIFNPTGHQGPYPVGDTDQNFLQYFVASAHEAGIKVDLSFGGAIAGPGDLTLPKYGNQQDGARSAEDLCAFMDQYGIDSVDFDIEGSGTSYLVKNNDPKQLDIFFTQLHQRLEAEGKQSIITVEGSLSTGPDGALAPVFANYNQKFDGVNLMLYSQTQYYIDAQNETWGITNWIRDLTAHSQGTAVQEIMRGIHIGFYDQIDYTKPKSSAGTAYAIPPGLKNGEAAAFVYGQLLEDISQSFPHQSIDLGTPFLWTDEPAKLSQNPFMTDFFNYLAKNKK